MDWGGSVPLWVVVLCVVKAEEAEERGKARVLGISGLASR